MAWLNSLYYGLSVLLWVILFALGMCSLHQQFATWLQLHPKVMLWILGINRLPTKPVRTLRRFYLFLASGWTWLLVWSWWIMPVLKNYYYYNLNSLKSYQIARISLMIILAAYSAFGFFCIGKSLSIWFKEIYRRSDAV